MRCLAIRRTLEAADNTQFAFYFSATRCGFITVTHPVDDTIYKKRIWAELRAIQFLLQEYNVFDTPGYFTGRDCHVYASEALNEEVVETIACLDEGERSHFSIYPFGTFLYFADQTTWHNIDHFDYPDAVWPLPDGQHVELAVTEPYQIQFPAVYCPLLQCNVYVTRHAIEQLVRIVNTRDHSNSLQPASRQSRTRLYKNLLKWLQNPALRIEHLREDVRESKLAEYGDVPIFVMIPSNHVMMTTTLDHRAHRVVVTVNLLSKAALRRCEYYSYDDVAENRHLSDISHNTETVEQRNRESLDRGQSLAV